MHVSLSKIFVSSSQIDAAAHTLTTINEKIIVVKGEF
jgi:hypothetical protein